MTALTTPDTDPIGAPARTSETGSGLEPRQGSPRMFTPHAYERSATVRAGRADLWRWLNTPETFTRQIWPYRVEFVEGSGVGGADGFEPGVLNIHHGPLLHCAGVIVAVDDGRDGRSAFRDLQYCYGAFIVSPRLIRPRRLRFWVGGDRDGACELRLRVDCDVRPWVRGVWTRTQDLFWGAFFRSAASGARRLAQSAEG